MKKSTIDRVNYYNRIKNLDIEIKDLNHFYRTGPKKMITKDYRMNFWAIIYVTEGTGTHYVDFKTYSYKPGDVIFVQKNQVQRFEINQEAQGYIIHINEPFFYQLSGIDGEIFIDLIDQLYESPLFHFDTTPFSTHRQLIDLIYREYSINHDRVNVELIASLFQSFILSLKNQVQAVDDTFVTKDFIHFKAFRHLVEAHYMETRHVESYAQMMHLTTKTINQATRHITGLSAKQFIIDRVILEIKRYLSQGELMNYEIADMLGFGEAANMSKFFKQYTGLSPKGFKEGLEH